MYINIQKVKAQFKRLQKLIIKRELLLALMVVLAMLVGGLYLGYLNNKIVPINASVTARYTLEPSNKFSFMSNWDGPDYLTIARHGYTSASQTNFFPLYPMAIRGVNAVIGSELDSALLISWVCLVGAIYFYIKIIKRLYKTTDNLAALKGILLFVLFPTGVFLLASYTESMFALFALGAIYFALTKRYISAGVLTLLATATHINGLFVLTLVGMILLEEHEKIIKILASLTIGVLGIVGYMIYLAERFNNAFAFISAQKQHGWLKQGYLNRLVTTIDLFNILFLILLALAVFYWWKRRKSFSLYSLFYICIPLLGGQFGGFNRYVLMAFPVQLMLYERFRNSKLLYPAIIGLSSICWCYFLLQYAGGYVGG
jgi:Gpi18-like mannosyltransferase